MADYPPLCHKMTVFIIGSYIRSQYISRDYLPIDRQHRNLNALDVALVAYLVSVADI